MEESVAENAMKIELRNLEDGETAFDFSQEPEGLDLAVGEIAFSGKIQTSVKVQKLSESLSASGRSTFTIAADCARCSEPIERTFESEFAFVFQKGKPRNIEGDEDETLVWLDEESDVLDLGKEVRDYILLEIPINPVCEAYATGTCPNLAIVEEIEKEAGSEEAEDPRWAALGKLKLDK